jgi:transglutaminase-like putative cysteine protease
MRLRVNHKTVYKYSAPVSICHSQAHLSPRDTPRQTCLMSHILIQPEPDIASRHVDCFGNELDCFTIQTPHRHLVASATSVVDVSSGPEPSSFFSPPWEQVVKTVRQGRTREVLEAYSFCFDSPLVAASDNLRKYAQPSFTPGRPLVDAAVDLTNRIFRDFKYDPGSTVISTPLETVLRQRRGVCQDLAHVQIGCLRAMGLPARYVSGYLLTHPPAGKTRLVGADASHAWAATWCPELAWLDLDPTNDLVPTDKHVTVAWGRDYSDVSPVRGVILGGGKHEISISVDVAPEEGEDDPLS